MIDAIQLRIGCHTISFPTNGWPVEITKQGLNVQVKAEHEARTFRQLVNIAVIVQEQPTRFTICLVIDSTEPGKKRNMILRRPFWAVILTRKCTIIVMYLIQWLHPRGSAKLETASALHKFDNEMPCKSKCSLPSIYIHICISIVNITFSG